MYLKQVYEFNGGIFYDPETGNCYVGHGPDAILAGQLEKGLSPEKARQGFWKPLQMKKVKTLP
jgi:hypothetical protein